MAMTISYLLVPLLALSSSDSPLFVMAYVRWRVPNRIIFPELPTPAGILRVNKYQDAKMPAEV